jgi:hypothetical protein
MQLELNGRSTRQEESIPVATSKTPPAPVSKIVAIAGDALTVALRPLPDNPQDVIFQVHRNGTREEKFTIVELTQVLNQASTLLSQARARSLNIPAK